MPSAPAARVGDPVTHSSALGGLIAGAAIGLVAGAAVVASGGSAVPLLLAAGAATGASLGGMAGKFLGGLTTHAAGAITAGSPNVRVDGKPAAFCTSASSCDQHAGSITVAQGSSTVRINGLPAARTGDKGSCGFVVGSGSPNVTIGGAPAACGSVGSEVPWQADTALFVLGLAGGGAALAARGLGTAAITARLGGSLVGGTAGSAGGSYAGGKIFGEGSTGQSVLAFGGAVLGGTVGYRGGAEAQVAVRTALARQRQLAMLEANRGFNVSPVSWDKYPAIGRAGTYLSDQRAITDVIGPLPKSVASTTISPAQAARLESAMGLEHGSLSGGFKVRQVDGVRDMAPRSPLEGNQYFVGSGKHLPGGGPELVVNPISTKDGSGVTTLMEILVK